MQLHTLMKLIKHNFQVDEELRAYIYNNRIKFIDFTSGFTQDDITLNDFYGKLLTIYYDEETLEIKSIEPHCLSIITPVNKEVYKYLADLIGKTIDDLNNYPKTMDLADLSYQSC